MRGLTQAEIKVIIIQYGELETMVFASVNKKAQRTRQQTCTSMDI